MSLKKRLERLKVKVAKVNKPVTAPASSGDDGPGREFWGSLPAAICIALFDARRAAGGEGRPLAELLAELKLPPGLRDQVDDAMRHGKWRGDPNPLIVTQEEFDGLRRWVDVHKDRLTSEERRAAFSLGIDPRHPPAVGAITQTLGVRAKYEQLASAMAVKDS